MSLKNLEHQKPTSVYVEIYESEFNESVVLKLQQVHRSSGVSCTSRYCNDKNKYVSNFFTKPKTLRQSRNWRNSLKAIFTYAAQLLDGRADYIMADRTQNEPAPVLWFAPKLLGYYHALYQPPAYYRALYITDELIECWNQQNYEN